MSKWAPVRYADGRPVKFWNQLAIALVFYFGYEYTSQLASGSTSSARRDALWEVSIEKRLHFFVEQKIQHFFLRYLWLIKLSNFFYVTVHFILPVVILVLLYRRDASRFLRYRNVFAWMTAISFVIFIVFPVMPPRLLPASYHFIDTQLKFGGAGKLDATLMKEAGNPYAAMPSLHFAWAAWCALGGYKVVKSKLLRYLLLADPFITIFVVIVTANHFFLDIIGGALVLSVSMLLAGIKKKSMRVDSGWFNPIR